MANKKERNSIIFFLLFLSLLVAAPAYSTGSGHITNTQTRPKIGLVLSGGGARGAAHIGVIKVLEDLHIPIDYITGTSMGSIVGGLYASGMSTDEIRDILVSTDWSTAFKDSIPREERSFRRKKDDELYLYKSRPGISDTGQIKLPVGLLEGQAIDLMFKRLTLPVADVRSFDQLSIPYRAVATDIVTGKAVVLANGDLATAMRASMSIPPLFSPVEIDGKLLVDGGVSNNLPIDIARELGADIVIVVDISTPLLTREEIVSTISVTDQLTGILTRRNTEEQLATLSPKDVLIIPDLGSITSSSFEQADKAVPIGKDAALSQKDKLLPYSLAEKDYAEYTQTIVRKPKVPPVISFVELVNQSAIDDKILMHRLDIVTGQPLDSKKLQNNIDKIVGLELFENVSYEIINKNNSTGIRIIAKEKSWGPNYLQTGITISDNLKGDNTFNLGIAYTRTALNKLAGEWRTALQIGESPGIVTELYQPFGDNLQYFVQPYLFYTKNNVSIYNSDGIPLSEYRVTDYGLKVATGIHFGTWGEFRLGIERSAGYTDIRTGEDILDDTDFNKGEWSAQFSVDTLNNRYFPTRGRLGSLKYIDSLEELGADSAFDQLLFDYLSAHTFGAHTVLAGAHYHTTLTDDAPLQNIFLSGGLFNFSGYNKDSLSGQHLGLIQLGYMHKIGDFNLFPTYIGVSLEGGNVWQDKNSISLDDTMVAGSVFIGVDTIIGPLFVGYGIAENDNQSFYFALGKLF